jgi:diguanylate cyclase
MRNADSKGIAEKALKLLASWQLAPDPATFEIAYTYVAGTNPALTGSIRLLLKTKQAISLQDVARLRSRYFPDTGRGETVLGIAEKLSDEGDEVASLIEVSVARRLELQGRLNQAKAQLGLPLNRVLLREIVDAVMTTSREFGRENYYLGATLNQSYGDISQLQERLTLIREETLRDPLTGLANRRHFNQHLNRLLDRLRENGKAFALLLADIDHFKNFNDSYGHLTGDHILKLIASTLQQNVKESDLVARYGGGVFAVVLAQVDLTKAISVAERLRRAVAANHVERRSTGERLGHATISVGLAMARSDECDQVLIEAASNCLYEAKKAGRNRVFSESDVHVLDEIAQPGSGQGNQQIRRLSKSSGR